MSKPTADLLAKAARLVDQGRLTWVSARDQWIVRGDSGQDYVLTWDGVKLHWRCPCSARGYPCSHVLAVDEYERREEAAREKEQTMTSEAALAREGLENEQARQRQAALPQTQAMTPQSYHGEPEGQQLESIIKISAKLSKSGLFRTRRKVGDKWVEEYASEADVFMIALSGIDFGLSAAASARHLKMIQGALSVSAELMRARLHQFGYEYALAISPTMVQFPVKSFTGYGNNRREVEKQQTGPESITVHLWRRGNPETRWSATYTIAEAVQAGLTKGEGGWDKNPEDMLVARGTTRVVRRYAPEILNKAYLPEELGFYEESDGQEGTRLVQVQVNDVPTSSAAAAPPSHDPDTGESIPDGDFTVDQDPEPVEAANGETHAMTPDRSAPPPADAESSADAECREAIAEPWHWPAVPEQRCREVMATLGYTTEQADAEITAVTNDIMLRALVTSLKGKLAEHQAQQSAGMDFDDYERSDSGRVDEPLPEDGSGPEDPEEALPFGDEPGPVPEGVQAAPPAAPAAPAVTAEQAEAWVNIWASAEATVDGGTVPDALVNVIARKDSWRKYMMEELGYGFGEQEGLMRGFELGSDPGKLTKGQRLGLIWWAEKHGKAAAG